jgi:superfamily II DNA/RNA helicase
MTFAQLNLDPQISKALVACGYNNPTPIQAKSIPDILLGKDMVASAQTGTGKTAAFVLPALHRLATQAPGKKPRVLILTPTRELASQITQAVGKYGKFLRCNIASLVGGMPYRQQLRDLSRAVDIIVATPGRLLDHMSNRRIDLSGIEMLILDEADRMLDMGFIDDVRSIANETPENRQTLLFSATVDNRLSQVIRQLLKDPIRIDFSNEKLTPTKIAQELYMADNPQHKMRLLMHFIQDQNIFKAIIFSATKINADRLAGELIDQGFAAAALHGDLKQNVRTRTVEQLRRGKIQFLIATDVAARGIDINDVTHVINFDLPKFAEDYVHRIGRTGRAGKTGVAISFALSQDIRHVQRIERLMKQQLERKTIEGLEPKKQARIHMNDAPRHKPKKKSGGSSSGFGKGKAKRSHFDDAPGYKSRKKEGSTGDFAKPKRPRRDNNFDDAPRYAKKKESVAKRSDRAGDDNTFRRRDDSVNYRSKKTEGKTGRASADFSKKQRSYRGTEDSAPKKRGDDAPLYRSKKSDSASYRGRDDSAPKKRRDDAPRYHAKKKDSTSSSSEFKKSKRPGYKSDAPFKKTGDKNKTFKAKRRSD